MDMISAPAKTRLTGEDLLTIEAEHPDKLFELIEGELREYPMPGLEHSDVENLFAFFLTLYNREKKIGTVFTGAAGFYTRGDNTTVRMADIAFISYERLPAGKIPSGYGTIAPELVVEIISPGNSADEMEEKIQEWLKFGVSLVWVVYPKTQRVHVYDNQRQVTILSAEDTITGGNVLPEFSVKVSEFFGG